VALRKDGADALADQISGLPIVVQCECAPRCGAFQSVPLNERADGTVTTTFVLHNAEMTVLVDDLDGVIVGLDVLDSGQLRTAVDRFVKPS
jgi:hypothetical protein